MTKILNLNNCPLSDKNGLYGGMAGSKDGILINGSRWLEKYPKSTSGMKNVDISYTTSPVCEYLGSHVYELLGYDVHKTLLGIRKGKLVVACRDFTDENTMLAEIRTIKNHANQEIGERLGIELESTGDSHCVYLQDLMIHLRNNPILVAVPGIERHFFEQAVIDIFINNSDRNNGNWGLLRHRDGSPDTLAPIFDNGGSFQDKISDSKAATRLSDRPAAEKGACGTQTVYADAENHILSCRRFLELQSEYPLLRQAIIDVVPKIREKTDDIRNLINDIPEMVKGPDGKIYEVCGPNIKKLYLLQLESRFRDLLVPAYEKARAFENSISDKRGSVPKKQTPDYRCL